MANPHGYSQSAIQLLAAELAKRGVTGPAAAGAIAGLMGESGANLDPTSFNTKDPGGGSGGIGQWNRDRLIGPRGMLAFAKNAGVDVNINTPTDAKKVPLGAQIGYLGHELDTRYSGTLKQLQSAGSAQDALNVWVNSYENPLDKAGAIRQRSQYLQPVSAALGSTLNTTGGGGGASGAPAGPAGGGAPSGATPAPQQQFAGVKAGSPAEKAMAAAQKSFAPASGQDQPQLPAPPQLPPAQAQGGLMMMGPGGMNQLPRALAQQYLQSQGVQTAPSLASLAPTASTPHLTGQPLAQSNMPQPGQASGAPMMPGTTLNSPSQLQMALMTGALNPYDLYSAGGGGFGGYQGS